MRLAMNFYERWVLPPLLDLTMRQRQLGKYRRELVSQARGRVLEIGVGSGLNLPFYGGGAESIIGLDPSEPLLAMAHRRTAEAGARADLVLASATSIPLPNASVDTLVMTWTLCSIPDPLAALREMHRVLKPGGALLFVEHGLSPDPAVGRWQRRLTPVWGHVSGGCHLDRKVDDLIRAAGFEISELRTEYAAGPRLMTYMYAGRASPVASVPYPGSRGDGAKAV
ncbi:Phospholipid methyltransferase (plasmid) [Methylocella tundrae]|uniref:Phospholipid methyltransferase n=2 Tax=Methylocella tundrae TaxID=227605 RepID=A0A4U8Z773_METTU|nr:Phospholipid methyltransferase [Methylocella tundrae]